MPLRLFISYSHVDSHYIDRLHKHLAQLERDGDVSGWYDREIHAGSNLDESIKTELEAADVFIACASPDYIASEYCYDKELAFALNAEADGQMAIVPLILEPCEWLKTPLSKFKAVPTDGKPVADFTNPNAAFLNVASELRRLAENTQPRVVVKSNQGQSAETGAVHSRYRVKRDHDELHKRDFLEDAAKEIYRFFQASVEEVSEIPDIEARLSDFDGSHFQCTLINRGKKRAFETLHVRIGGSFAELDILFGERNEEKTSHGGFSVKADDYELYFAPALFGYPHDNQRLTAKEVAQSLWDQLLDKVGISYA